MTAKHQTPAYKKLRHAFWTRLAAAGVVAVPCARCGKPVNVTAANAGTHPWSRSVDHVDPFAPPHDVTRWAPSHLKCNRDARRSPLAHVNGHRYGPQPLNENRCPASIHEPHGPSRDWFEGCLDEWERHRAGLCACNY
jgi:hypothetical protein